MNVIPKNVLELPLEQRAEIALKAAVEKVLVESVRAGLPVYIWRDGRVAKLSRKEVLERIASSAPTGSS